MTDIKRWKDAIKAHIREAWPRGSEPLITESDRSIRVSTKSPPIGMPIRTLTRPSDKWVRARTATGGACVGQPAISDSATSDAYQFTYEAVTDTFDDTMSTTTSRRGHQLSSIRAMPMEQELPQTPVADKKPTWNLSRVLLAFIIALLSMCVTLFVVRYA